MFLNASKSTHAYVTWLGIVLMFLPIVALSVISVNKRDLNSELFFPVIAATILPMVVGMALLVIAKQQRDKRPVSTFWEPGLSPPYSAADMLYASRLYFGAKGCPVKDINEQIIATQKIVKHWITDIYLNSNCYRLQYSPGSQYSQLSRTGHCSGTISLQSPDSSQDDELFAKFTSYYHRSKGTVVELADGTSFQIRPVRKERAPSKFQILKEEDMIGVGWYVSRHVDAGTVLVLPQNAITEEIRILLLALVQRPIYIPRR